MDNEKHQDLGSWAGLQKAFAAVAGSCSAARAQCFKQVRDSHRIEDLGLTGDESEKVASRRATNPFSATHFRMRPANSPVYNKPLAKTGNAFPEGPNGLAKTS